MKTVLIIEDNEQNLYLARFILEQRGHRVEAATNGPEGISAALRLRPDLILLDIQLPGMDGHEVAARLRARSELAEVPIVAVTSFAMAGDRDRILAAGCSGYLEKPIDPDTFLTEVERAFRPGRSAGPGRRILVVDDVKANRDVLATLLGGHGFEVAAAADGRQALELARRSPPDLIIADILMPVMDGFTLCREWRADPALTAIPFVFHTATYTDSEAETFGLGLGAARFLVKPVEPDELLREVRSVLGSPPPSPALNAPPPDEPSQLRTYNALLIRKLEEKMLQLERGNAELERKVGERTRQLEAANLELQAASQVGTWTSERSPSRVLTWSAETCRIFGLAPREFDRRLETFLDAVHPEDRAAHQSAMQTAWSGTGPLDNVLRIRRRDGTLRWVHIQGRLEDAPNGDARRLVGVVRDITEQRVLQEQLAEARRLEAIGRLAGGIAHDFNNLMTVVDANASLLLANAGLPEPHARLVDEILAASRRACELTGRLLTFSRRQVPVLRPLELNGVVTGMVKLLRRIVGENIVLRDDLTPDLPCVMADKGMMEQVIMNLVVNARDALPGGGEIALRTSVEPPPPGALLLADPSTRPATCVCLAVSDTGVGIPPEILPHIFEPFFTTKQAGQGSGLGLATVYGILRQHGGGIEVSSRPGAGTTFRIFVPVTHLPPEPSTSAVTGEIPRGRETLLLVEDESAVRHATRLLLGNLGYRTVEAANAVEALRVWNECGLSIDLLLTDLVMPGGLTGLQLAERLRSRRPELRVVFMSGHSPNRPPSEDDAPGTAFLPKPFNLTQLALVLRRVLDAAVPSPAPRPAASATDPTAR